MIQNRMFYCEFLIMYTPTCILHYTTLASYCTENKTERLCTASKSEYDDLNQIRYNDENPTNDIDRINCIRPENIF